MRSRRHPLWCPACNEPRQAQPILSELVLTFDPEPTSYYAQDYRERAERPQFRYQCQRCGYAEIHTTPIVVRA